MEFIVVIIIVFIIYLFESKLYANHWNDDLEYRCYFTENEVTVGDEIELIEEITNSKRMPIPCLKSEFTMPDAFDIVGVQTVVTDKTRFLSGYFYLKGCSKITRKWKVKVIRRGVYEIKNVVIVASNILGSLSLSSSVDKEDIGGVVTILPKKADVENMHPLCEGIGGDNITTSLFKDPFMISGVREYEYGDNAKQINRNASAKQGKIMSSVYSGTAIERVAILPCTYGLCEGDAEYCISIVATLCEMLLQNNVEVAILSAYDKLDITGYGSTFEHEINLLESLARIDTAKSLRLDDIRKALLNDNYLLENTMLYFVGMKNNADGINELAEKLYHINSNVIIGENDNEAT